MTQYSDKEQLYNRDDTSVLTDTKANVEGCYSTTAVTKYRITFRLIAGMQKSVNNLKQIPPKRSMIFRCVSK